MGAKIIRTKIGTEPPHIYRHHSQVSDEVCAPSPCVGMAGYCGSGTRHVSVCPAMKGCSRRGVVMVLVASWRVGGSLKGLLWMGMSLLAPAFNQEPPVHQFLSVVSKAAVTYYSCVSEAETVFTLWLWSQVTVG